MAGDRMTLSIEITRRLPGFKLQVSLSCGQEIVGVLGASGSGKSMLLNSVAGIIRPDRGRITLDDRVFFDAVRKIHIPPRERKVGYLFQNYAMFPHLTVEENIAFGLGNLSKEEQHKKISVLLERFHLSEMGKRYPAQLSGGQQQRVALARALAVEPKILLLDEPFSALDEHLKIHMLKEMKESLKSFGGTTLFVTHNMEEAYRLCDRIVVLNDGAVETLETKEAIFRRPTSFMTAKITGCKNIAAAVRTSPNHVDIPEWGIRLKTAMPVDSDSGFLGFRANHIRAAKGASDVNCFPAWIADESEAPFRTNLYLKLGAPPQHPGDFHLQWELSREERDALGASDQPIRIFLDPERAFFMER